MYAIGVILIALSVVSADVGLGYHYKVPHTSYGEPSYQFGGNSKYIGSGSSVNYKGQTGEAVHIGSTYAPQIDVTPSSVHLGSIYSPQSVSSHGVLPLVSTFTPLNTKGNTVQIGSTYAPQSAYQIGGVQAGSGGYYQPIVGALNGYQTYNQYQTSNQYQTQQKYHQYYQVPQQPAQVFKHFYVHSAPEEPEPIRPRQPIVLPPPQKHYKIIFVKAPTQSTRTSQIVQVPQQNEEKTIVYVLVKKPEEHQEVIVPKVEQKPPTKPEVYYIKYNNKQDSQAVINNIVNDFNKGGQPVTFSGSGQYDASGIPDVSYATAPSIVGTSSFQSVPSVVGSTGFVSRPSTGFLSGFGNLADSPVESHDSTFGTQSFDVTNVSSGTPSFGVVDSSDILSSTAAPALLTSTIEYDSVNTISSSQGIPHESYGPPTFRKD